MARKKRTQPASGPAVPDPSLTPAPAPPKLTSKNRQTLVDLFARPEKANIAWNDFVAMMLAAGAEVRTGGGSAHSFVLLGRVLVIHRPHPGNEIPKPAVRSIRKFLDGLGIRP